MPAQVKTIKDLVVVPTTDTPADRSIEKRRLRKHHILNVIREHGPLSRADISKVSGYNLRSVSSLVEELLGDDLVYENDAVEVPRGRRPIPVHLNRKAAAALGIDIGRRRTTGLLMDLGGHVIHEMELKTPECKRPDKYADWTMTVAEKMFESASDVTPPLCGIGVAVPGLIAKKGLRVSYTMQEAAEHIRRELIHAYGVEVMVENDARMMAMGYLWFGKGGTYNSFAVLKIGAGLGLGIVEEGRTLQGAMGFAGELGHIPMGDNRIQCPTGQYGCLENIASGAGITRMAEERGLEKTDAKEVAELVRQGNLEAKQIFHEFTVALGRGIATVLNLYNPEAVILGGRVASAADVFLDDLREIVAAHTLPPIWETTDIIVANGEGKYGSLGAGAVVLHHIYYSAHVTLDSVI